MAKDGAKRCKVSAINDESYSPEIMGLEVPFAEYKSAVVVGQLENGEFRFWYSNCTTEILCAMEKALSIYIQQLMTD